MGLLKAKNIDATTGSLFKKIILYSLPLMLSTLIQQLFNAVDIMVLGNMANSTAVASVAATSSITSLIVTAFVGIATGTRVVLARFIGAKDEKNARQVTDTSLIFAVVIGAVIAVVGFILAPWFLDITECPPECYEGALIYVRIYVSAAPFILLYNFGSSVITADGDTQRPLYYIMIAGAVNVVLNIILCFMLDNETVSFILNGVSHLPGVGLDGETIKYLSSTLDQKVVAVAVATVASQVIGAVLVSFRLLTMDGICRVKIQKMCFGFSALGKVLAAGLPMALVHALFPLSNLQIQSAINSYGVTATAGNGAASTIETVVSAFPSPFGTAAAVFIGQNIGAKKPDRVRKSFWYCMIMTTAVAVVVGVGTYLTGRFWLSLIVGSDAEAIEFGLVRMSCTTLFYFVAAINGVFASAILAHGFSVASAINSVFSVFVFRIIWMQVLYPHNKTFLFVMACFVVSWGVRMLANFVIYGSIWHGYKKKTDLLTVLSEEQK